MSAAARIARLRAVLSVGVGVGALLWGAAVLTLAFGAFAAVEWLVGLPRGLRLLAVPASLVFGSGAWAAVMWRGRRVRSGGAVALWIEERFPLLRYALVTAADPYCESSPAQPELERRVALTSWSGVLTRALARALAVPAALLVAGLIALRTLPAETVARIGRPPARDALDLAFPGSRGRRGSLEPLVATVTPPAYTGQRRFVVEEPATIAAIAGSAVVLEGRGAAPGISAVLSADTLAVRGAPGRWLAAFTMPQAAVALRLGDGAAERLIVIEPYPDSLPVVTLTAPLRDSVLREPRGTLTLSADLSDDIGLAAAWFEFIVSSGERESFTFRAGRLGRASLGGARTALRRVVLSLDSLRLAPGDVLHLRAVASDGNTVTGPGVGVSETRAIRIARQGEYDSVAVEGMPPVAEDTSALSQRMLILLAEALERRRPGLARAAVVEESQRIGEEQARLRRRVADAIFTRLSGEASAEETAGEEGRTARSPEQVVQAAESAASRNAGELLDFSEDESPVVAVNRPLLEAYNAMWDASRELNIGEPDDALPHMRVALAAIQRARQAERVYLRGRPPTVVVDLARVRLAGERGGVAASPRAPQPALRGSREALATRFTALLGLLPDSAAAFADSLQLLRLDALASHPRFAAALGEVVTALRRGREVTAALVRVRAAIAGASVAAPALPRWEGGW